jgi:hypothetical protein
MIDKTPPSFQQLWENAEEVSKKLFETTHPILVELISKISRLNEIYEKPNDEEVRHAKARLIGEITFLISALTMKENVNIYSLLNDQIFLNTL